MIERLTRGRSPMNALEVLNQTRDAMTARRVYGEPYQQDGVTVIPAANVWGGGGGGGDTEGNGGGGVGGVARPPRARGVKDGGAGGGPADDGEPLVLLGPLARGLAVLPGGLIP